MENKKGSLSTVFLVIAIILIGVMGYMMYQMNSEIKQLSEKVANSENATANDTVTENNNDLADITAKCKTAFEEYYDLQQELYSGGSLYVLKKLDLVSTTPAPEQYETTTYGADDFYKTDIKYSDFKNAMLKYMTSEVFEKDFEKYHAKNVDGYLHITAMGGTATNIDIDKFELSSNDNGSYIFNISAERRADDNPSIDTVNIKVTFEKQNGNYVVSNVEDDKNEIQYIEMTEDNHKKYNTGKNKFIYEDIINNNDKTITIKGRVYEEIELPTITKEQYQDLIADKTIELLGYKMKVCETNVYGGHDLLIESTTDDGMAFYVDKNSDGTGTLMYRSEIALYKKTNTYMKITVDESIPTEGYSLKQLVGNNVLENQDSQELRMLPGLNDCYIFENGKCTSITFSTN